jgi:uncharacterized protein YbjQ (UPF0145 family)
VLNITPFVLSLSKHCSSSWLRGKEEQPFDKLGANGRGSADMANEGVVVRSRGIGGNIAASLRSIVGGEIKEYTALVEETRRHAVDRLIQNATLMGGNAVVMMRFDSGSIGETMNEVVAYGTAVIVEADKGGGA